MMRWDCEGDGSGRRRSSPMLGIAVAHRQPLLAAALAALVERLGHRVAATVCDWPTLVAVVDAGTVDVALRDIDLDAVDGAAMAGFNARVPNIVVAPTAGHAGLLAALEGGAAGLLLCTEGTDALRLCLAAITAGGRWFDSAALAEVAETDAARQNADLLTRRERDVARLVATGQRNRAIAGALGISEGTVKMHLHNVYAKLGLESRTQLAMDERLRARG